MSTALTDTLNRAATSTRSRPSTNADTASNRTASCASGDQLRASPTTSLTRHQRACTQSVSDQYARDLAELIEHLELQDIVPVGHSTGGGEIVRYAAQHGAGRVSKIVTAGAVPPLMVKSESSPEGTPLEVFDGIRGGLLADRSQFYKDLAVSFFGANREGSAVSQGAIDNFWRQGMLAGLVPAYDCVKAFSETDQTDDLRALDVPVFIAHGGDDQIVPIAAAAEKSVKLVKDGTLEVYPGAPHGIYGAYETELISDILAFIKG
ncbi:alpha/beta fold hydrolase [Streptomyces sp. SPB074]|uniref:alpha/beta fold hydrolase n=1 Tax=Streptomyces sp. (strain SPB074) TaxID=465543 RepID=UPI00017FEF2A|nr:alpha/beta hydrolase [Streptomyces sp. SPB074]EDY45710.1 non-heme chloroperoxidase [Streptomyces sp. SPB074]